MTINNDNQLGQVIVDAFIASVREALLKHAIELGATPHDVMIGALAGIIAEAANSGAAEIATQLDEIAVTLAQRWRTEQGGG